jgi:hypothetical protein
MTVKVSSAAMLVEKAQATQRTIRALRARAAGRSAGVGSRRALAGSVTTPTVLPVMSKKLDEVAVLADASDGMALYDGADVAGTNAALGDIVSQDHLSVQVGGQVYLAYVAINCGPF